MGLQKLHRDTQKCAFKCSYAVVKGNGRDVMKDPITDKGKRSKKGRLSLQRYENGKWETVAAEMQGTGTDKGLDHLVTVYKDGCLHVDRSMANIRERSNQVSS